MPQPEAEKMTIQEAIDWTHIEGTDTLMNATHKSAVYRVLRWRLELATEHFIAAGWNRDAIKQDTPEMHTLVFEYFMEHLTEDSQLIERDTLFLTQEFSAVIAAYRSAYAHPHKGVDTGEISSETEEAIEKAAKGSSKLYGITSGTIN